MRHANVARFLSCALCAAAVALGGVFCPVTAFSVPVDTARLAELCLLLALGASLLMGAKHRGRWLAGGLLLTALLVLARWESVKNGFLLTEEAFFWYYRRAFAMSSGIEAIGFDLPEDAAATGFFALIGGVLAVTVAWTVTGGRTLLPVAALSVPLAVLCLMVAIPPAPWALLLLIGGWLLLLLSRSLGRRDPEAGQRLLLRLCLPTAALLILLCLAVRPGAYVRPGWPDTLQEKIQAAVDWAEERLTGEEGGVTQVLQNISGQATLGLFSWNAELERTDLSSIGPQRQSGRRVMQVFFDKSGRYYLRGNSLAVYDGESWSALPESAYEGLYIERRDWLASGGEEQQARIKTDIKASILYLPYTPTELPESASVCYDAYVRNTDYAKDYTISYADGGAVPSSAYERFVYENYLQVPEETRSALASVIDGLTGNGALDGSPEEIAARIADYVRASAVYDLDTSRMPRGEDFASWFLLESDTGYCVHFATAAAVLLRCLDIPSRYVSGYVVNATAGDWTAVKSSDAHAWVEYYVSGEGWKMLESTPGGPAEAEPEAGPEPTPETVPEAEETAPPRETPAQTAPPRAGETPTPTRPAADGPGEGGGSGAGSGGIHIPGWLWWVLAAVLAPALWRAGIKALRGAALRRGGRDRRALACYHSILRLSRFSGTEVPRFVRETAEKARFSRGGVSLEELSGVMGYLDTLQAAARADKNPLRWVIYRVVWAL